MSPGKREYISIASLQELKELGVTNPYKSEPSKAEFFFCGFLKDTKIFVADSLVDEKRLIGNVGTDAFSGLVNGRHYTPAACCYAMGTPETSLEGYIKTGEQPQGYTPDCLICEVEVENKPYHTLPCDENEWEYYDSYRKHYVGFMKQAREGKIDNNPTIALKSLITPREGEEEVQEVRLKFAEGTYVHHRAMRDVWREMSSNEKEAAVPSKSLVHGAFSTSFGLHVAVLTADDPPKFFFCRRANRVGMASPSEYTCGAVESVSKKDCFEGEEGKWYASLLKTAGRGLEEELRVELIGNETNAICLTTVYLKFDTHEWGMCGFVNLADPRIAPERRLTYKELQSRFVSGPKDKFEHDIVQAVDFTLESMMDFVRQNFNEFSSSGKLVVVKVLQSFFGVRTVELAFQSIDV